MKWLLLLPFMMAACSSSTSQKWTSFPREVSGDFFVTVAKVGKTLPTAAVLSVTAPVNDPSSCEQHLKLAVCETTASSFEISHNYTGVQCSSQSDQYVPALMDIYNEMPEKMRVSLCSLDRVFLSDNITSVAFASTVVDEFGQRTGGYIGMRKGTFLSQPSIEEVASWKEQLTFGGSQSFLANEPKLVQLHYNLRLSTLKASGLFYILMHELGHLIDFNNQVDSQRGAATDWSRLSWSGRAPTADATFFRRDDVCYYNCGSQAAIDPADGLAMYQSLAKSAFVSTYASTTPWEDFAETWAWRMMENYKSPDYRIEIPGQGSVDMNEVFRSNSKVQAKIQFVDRLWNDPNLKIDNRVP